MAQGLFTLKQVNQAIQQSAWPNLKTPAVDYLVIAGGGAGGGGAAYSGGGAGAGGLLTGSVPVTAGTSYTVTIGAGASSTNVHGGNGTDSVFGPITSTGGGGGTYGYSETGYYGGSGGGAGSTYSTTVTGTNSNGVFGQGNGGGSNIQSGSGAGGGAGKAGLSSVSTSNGAPGGMGITSTITGAVVPYAGGGASGSVYASGTFQSIGGVGGGGNGAYYNGTTAYVATAGTANTGGGGGGGCNGTGCTYSGGGGSGVVVLSYPDVYAAPTSTTGSPTVSTSGSGSLAFSGSGQYLSTPSNSGLAFGTGDFTFETWFYANSRSGEPGLFQISATAGGLQTSYTDLTIIIGTAPYALSCIVGNTDVTSGTTYISENTWYHLAVTRSSGSVRVFVNGVLAGGPTTVTTNLTGTYAAIGGYYTTSYLFNGRLSNLRVVKGTALYTSNFTPSTVPLTAISGTSLLMNTVSGSQFVDGSSNYLIMTANGPPTWSALSPFTTTGYKNRVYTWTGSGSITF